MRRRELGDVRRQQPRDEVLAGGVDQVEQHDQPRDQKEIPVAEHEAKPAGRRFHRVGCRAPALLTAVDPHVDAGAYRQQRRGDLEDDLRRKGCMEQPGGDERAERRAGRHADHDDRKEPGARFLRVEIVGERPELRDQGDVEDADPDEKGDADVWHARRHCEREQLEAGDEEQRDAKQQLRAADPRGKGAVQRDEADEYQRLARGRVGANLRAAAEEDQRLPHRFDDRIADEQQEDVREHQQRGRAFTGTHVCEER